MPQRRGRKRVAYLDQNWLSDMTKAVRLDGSPRVDKGYFTELYKVILRAIAEDRIVCPTSPTHMSESNLDSRRSADFRSVDNAVSRGLSFNPSDQILHNQLLESASKFAGVRLSDEPCWWTPFNRDPDVPYSTLPDHPNGVEVFVTVEEWVNEERRMRNQISAPIYREYKESRKEINLSYLDEVAFSKYQLFREGYLGMTEAISQVGKAPAGFNEIYQMAVLRQHNRIIEIKQICDKGAGLAAFVSSDEFADVPYLSVRAKLMAADIVYHASRSPESSLLDDFDIAATVVPYVNVFATENYLADLLRVTGVATDYSCTAYTMRQRDKFLDYLPKL